MNVVELDMFLSRRMKILRDRFVQRFGDRSPLARITVVPNSKASFGPHIFLETDQQALEVSKSDLGVEMVEFIHEELSNLGFGPRESLEVLVRFRSREEVDRDFGGSFYYSMQ